MRWNHIEEIKENDIELTSNSTIANAFLRYCQCLYAAPVDIEKFKGAFLGRMPQLSSERTEALESPITGSEIETVIYSLTPGKSPGPDGLGATFYKAFKKELCPVIQSVFKESYRAKASPPSFAETHTVLFPKREQKEKLMLVTSYRPISLTNTHYKIFMKVLAGRLQSVIAEIVGEHQTRGIKAGSIFANTHTMRCVLECCGALQSAVAILQLDLEKAFDRVPHDALFATLEHVNVGSGITDGVDLAYQNSATRLIINMMPGDPIKLERSVRQGCLAAYCLKISGAMRRTRSAPPLAAREGHVVGAAATHFR